MTTPTLMPGTYTLPPGTTVTYELPEGATIVVPGSVVVTPPPVVPPPPAMGPGYVCLGSTFGPGFAGDTWTPSNASLVHGPSAITVNCLAQWAEWIANAVTSNSIDGNFPLAGYTDLVISLTPHNPGFLWQVVIVQPCANPNVVDALCEGNPITFPVQIDTSGTYGPAPQVGVAAEYVIPLSALGNKVGARKVACQVQGANGAGTSFDINHCYFR
jgi:hypothetical protein